MAGFISEGVRQVCEDYFPHNCQTCEFDFIKGGTYCPKVIETPCPHYRISAAAFGDALEKWEREHPGKEVETYGNE